MSSSALDSDQHLNVVTKELNMKNDRSPVATTIPSSEQPQGSFTYDPDFRGPVKQRSCTDVICFCLFLGFIAGWVVLAVFAFKNGNPAILMNPTDSQGNICGMHKFKSKPYLYFFDIMKCASPSVVLHGCKTPQVCVENCPNETFAINPLMATDDMKKKLICKNNADMSQSIEKLLKQSECAAYYLKSKPFRVPKAAEDILYPRVKDPLAKRCIPDFIMQTPDKNIYDGNNKPMKSHDGKPLQTDTVAKATKMLSQFMNLKEFGKKIFSDLKLSWKLILIALVLTMVLCFIWIVLMRYLAGPMVWFSIIALAGLSSFACYFSVDKYLSLRKTSDHSTKFHFTTNLKSYLLMKDLWLAFAILSSLVILILFVLLVFLRKRLLIAIALIQEGSRAVSTMFTALLFPVIPYSLQLGVISLFVAVSLYIAASGKAKFAVHDAAATSHFKNGDACKPWEFNATDARCSFLSYGDDYNLFGGHLYNLFAMLWSLFFTIGMGQVSLAGAFAAYYWTLDKSRDLPRCAIGLGLWRCLRYHMGSVAFGSLLIAIVRTIRIVLLYLEKKFLKYDNKVTRALMCCLQCCFWCLEKFLKFISKNAYIMMAVYGANFCNSAQTAFMLLLRNAARVVVLDKVTDFLLFIDKMCIVAAAAAGTFVVFTSKIESIKGYIPSLHYNLLPVIVTTFGAYIIASVFFNVYSMAVDTLFLCFLQDLEQNDGSTEKPYYMSKELMKILDKKNKFREPKE